MSRDGYIVTNSHVVANARRILVSLANGATLRAHIVGTDPADDLAVVKVNGHSLPAATFGDSSKLAVGQTVLAIGFAIPSNIVTSIASQIIKYGKVIHSGRAALGVRVLTVTPSLAAQYGLPVDHGVLIASVVKGSPAAKAGLKPGDIVIDLGTQPIAGETDLLDALANKNPGDTVPITVVDSHGKQHVYRVKLGEFQVNST